MSHGSRPMAESAGIAPAEMPLTGRKQVSRAAPPTPEQTIENTKADAAKFQGSAHR